MLCQSVFRAMPLFHSCVVINAGFKMCSFFTLNNIIQSTSNIVPSLLSAHEKSVNRNSIPHCFLINCHLLYTATNCVNTHWCYIRVWLYIYSPQQLHDNNLNIRQFLRRMENAWFAVCDYQAVSIWTGQTTMWYATSTFSWMSTKIAECGC